jgi:hypothetical protein
MRTQGRGKKTSTLASESSRRTWLLKLAETAILFGFRGFACELKPEKPASWLSSSVRALPPGLYEPDSQHMADALTRDERYIKIPAGAETDYVQPRVGPFRPAFFDPGELRMVRQLIRLILGPPPRSVAARQPEFEETLTEIVEWVDLMASEAAAIREAARRLSPQHRALAVAYYGREAVEQLENSEPDKICREGLRSINAKCIELHGAPFLEREEAAQIQFLSSLTDARSRTRQFLSYLTAQIVRGFYTSRLGLKELGYKGNSFWVECPGCKAS